MSKPVPCEHAILRLPLTEQNVMELATLGKGGINYTAMNYQGAKFIGAWFAEAERDVCVAFSIEPGRPQNNWRFSLIPIAHKFFREPDTEMRPLSGLVINGSLFTLYEVIHTEVIDVQPVRFDAN